ncbi:Medium-chain fatty-acid--CoA ligase [compost metagenome]
MYQVEEGTSPVVGAESRHRHAEYYRLGFWRREGLWTSIAKVAEIQPDKTAVIDGERELSFAQLVSQAASLAGGMRRQGVGHGDTVLIQARNSVDALLAMLACARLGAIMAPIPPIFSAVQVAAICANAKARLLIALGESKEIARALEGARQLGCEMRIVVSDHYYDADGSIPFQSLFSDEQLNESDLADPDAPALLVYSSGTTGTPKGVTHSANTLRYAIEQRALRQGVDSHDICLVASQFGFVGSAVFGLLACAVLGVTTVLMRSWSGDDALRLIAQHRVSYALLMPTHVHDVLHSPLLGALDISSFRHASMSGLSRKQRLAVRELLCPLPFAAYGMSECLGLVSSSADQPVSSQLDTEGTLLPGNEMRIVNAEGLECSPGEIGEIVVRGPCCFLGYHVNPDLTASTLSPDGWLKTGDLGRLDEARNLIYVAREKDVIRRGGVNIYPGDTERVLAAHPQIEHVAIVAYPDDRLGERACACVVTRDGQDLSLEQLCSWLQSHGVARYLWPERVARFKSFPRSASLKVQKPVLVSWLKEMSA